MIGFLEFYAVSAVFQSPNGGRVGRCWHNIFFLSLGLSFIYSAIVVGVSPIFDVVSPAFSVLRPVQSLMWSLQRFQCWDQSNSWCGLSGAFHVETSPVLDVISPFFPCWDQSNPLRHLSSAFHVETSPVPDVIDVVSRAVSLLRPVQSLTLSLQRFHVETRPILDVVSPVLSMSRPCSPILDILSPALSVSRPVQSLTSSLQRFPCPDQSFPWRRLYSIFFVDILTFLLEFKLGALSLRRYCGESFYIFTTIFH